jgi:ABC-type amino acid transport substrate-binding protein
MAKFATHSRTIRTLVALTTIALCSAVAAAPLSLIERRGTLRVCVNPDAMPFSGLVDGEEGLHIDLARVFARELDVAPDFKWVQFRFQAKYTQCDAFMGVGIFPKAEPGPTKTTEPIFQLETLLVSRPGQKLVKLEDLDGLRVATQSGSLAHVTLLKRPVDVRVSLIHEEDILNAVANGDIDVGVVSNVALGWYLKHHPKKSFEVRSASIVQDVTGYPMAIGLRGADVATVKSFNAIIERLKTSGELTAILSNYGIEPLATATP